MNSLNTYIKGCVLSPRSPKWPLQLVTLIIVLSLSKLGHSQIDVSNGKLSFRPTGSTIAGSGYIEYLPDEYFTEPSRQFPIIIDLHGQGERGSGSLEDLNKLFNNGIIKLINDDNWPVVSSVTSQPPSDKFIVIAPQSGGSVGTFNAQRLYTFIGDIKTMYRADEKRIYLTGLSAGAISIWGFIKTTYETPGEFSEVVAAFVPIAGNGNSMVRDIDECNVKHRPIWGFHGDADTTVNTGGTYNPINAIRNCSPTVNDARVTIFKGVPHNSWDRVYSLSGVGSTLSESTSYSDMQPFNISVYDWLLSYSLDGGPVNQRPSVDAGLDQNLIFPQTIINLTGTANDDGLPKDSTLTFTWRLIEGAGPVEFLPPDELVTQARFLEPGNYRLQLEVSDGELSSSETVDVTFTANTEGADSLCIPLKTRKTVVVVCL
jgi:hypothetical protein